MIMTVHEYHKYYSLIIMDEGLNLSVLIDSSQIDKAPQVLLTAVLLEHAHVEPLLHSFLLILC